MATLLLELFSEEIPSRMQRAAAEQLERLIVGALEKHMLAPTVRKTFVSPRHLALQCFGLPDVQPDVREERKGPKVGAPEQAMKGFLGATGLTVEQCEQRDGYYFATIERKGRPTSEVVKQIVEEALAAFGWPKSMRWGARPLQWVRPLHRITCLLDGAVVPVQFAHLTASNVTEGHRFLAPAPITLAHAEQYEAQLATANVIVDYAARRAKIAAEIAALAQGATLQVVADEALLDEVTGLVEWPVPLLGHFDAKFLELPPEVLISEMKVHQRYFALQDAGGKLTNQFIAVANMVTEDGGKRIIAGNARVLRARLSDGEFYWAQDRKVSLEDWGKKLADVVFHAKVGMMDAKVARIEQLAEAIAKAVGFADTALVTRTARLCKADLTSGMVGEFPELQGIMGRYYALAQGEKPEIADAIYEHYKPQGAADSLPQTQLGAIIAVADKLDSIVSLFAAGEKPTGSKDPLALRRAALGVLRIVLDNELSIDLRKCIEQGLIYFSECRLEALKNQGVEKLDKALAEMHFKPTGSIEAAKEELLDRAGKIKTGKESAHYKNYLVPLLNEMQSFFMDRLQNVLREEGLRHDVIEAVLQDVQDLDALGIASKGRLLSAWLDSTVGKDALAAIKRALNILAAEEKKAKTAFVAALPNNLTLPSEMVLCAALRDATFATPADLARLTAPINQFFTDVLVNEPAFRDARLGLLAYIRNQSLTIADFSKIEG